MILNNIPKPQISSRFDVEDIRALRVWSSMRWKDADFEEIKNDINNRVKPIFDKIGYVFDDKLKRYVHIPQKN